MVELSKQDCVALHTLALTAYARLVALQDRPEPDLVLLSTRELRSLHRSLLDRLLLLLSMPLCSLLCLGSGRRLLLPSLLLRGLLRPLLDHLLLSLLSTPLCSLLRFLLDQLLLLP